MKWWVKGRPCLRLLSRRIPMKMEQPPLLRLPIKVPLLLIIMPPILVITIMIITTNHSSTAVPHPVNTLIIPVAMLHVLIHPMALIIHNNNTLIITNNNNHIEHLWQ